MQTTRSSERRFLFYNLGRSDDRTEVFDDWQTVGLLICFFLLVVSLKSSLSVAPSQTERKLEMGVFFCSHFQPAFASRPTRDIKKGHCEKDGLWYKIFKTNVKCFFSVFFYLMLASDHKLIWESADEGLHSVTHVIPSSSPCSPVPIARFTCFGTGTRWVARFVRGGVALCASLTLFFFCLGVMGTSDQVSPSLIIFSLRESSHDSIYSNFFLSTEPTHYFLNASFFVTHDQQY